MSVVIAGGKVFRRGGFTECDLLIENGRIAKIGRGLRIEGAERIDASGLLIFPGLVDPHVHLREPGAEYKEDFRTGTQAAVAGGFTAVIDMPNNPVPTITAERLEEKRRLAAKKAVCDVFFHFGATDGNFDEVGKADPLSLKIYMGLTTGELMLERKDSLHRHFANFPKGRPVVLHTADDSEDESRSVAASCANISFAASKAKPLGRKVHLGHASTARELVLAKKSGFSAEVAPHHLFLSKTDAERLGKFGTVYPPLRSMEQRKMLWEALPQADCIATDHAPHTAEDKEAGARGFPGLETSLALMLDAYNRKLLSLEWVVERMSEKPAEIFNLEGMGRIEEGVPANLTLIDLKKEWTVKGEEQFTKCGWSPFDGKKLKGKVHSVILEGKKIFEEGEFLL